MAKLPDELASRGAKLITRNPVVLWWCPQCDIYFQRLRTWEASARHSRAWRPRGATSPVEGGSAHGLKPRSCGGVASPLRDGPELAAYLIGGLEAVYAMGKRVN